MATAVLNSPEAISIDLIDVDEAGNRPLVEDHVTDLMASIELRGLINPITIRPSKGRFALVAGRHRLEACRRLGHSEIRYTLREQEAPSGDTAAENILRRNLSPLGEAQAVARMVDEGYTVEGTAKVLGWSTALVTARAKILELPENAQLLLDNGTLPVSTVEVLHRICSISPGLCEGTVQRIANGHAHGSQLLNNPSWVISSAVGSRSKCFSAILGTLSAGEIESLRLGKKIEAILAEARELYRKLNPHIHGASPLRFGELEVDQARAAGVLIEFDRGEPIITDRALYRELSKQAITRTRDELSAALAAAEKDRAERQSSGQPTPSAEQRLTKEHNRVMRELTRQAHGTNLDLGSALLKGLARVDLKDMNVARFFAYGLLGQTEALYSERESRVMLLTANGVRLVFEQHRGSERPTLASGKPGKEKISYAEPEDAVKWLWKFIDGARTPDELLGRVMVVFAAQHYAEQLVLQKSKRRSSCLPPSHNAAAAKAFERVVKPLLPASHKNLRRAIAAEAERHAEAERSLKRKKERSRRAKAPAAKAKTEQAEQK